MSPRELEEVIYFVNYVVIDPGKTDLIKQKVLTEKVLLTFVPKGIIKKYCTNKKLKKEALKLWKKGNVVKPMECKLDKNFKRFLMLRKRWLHYYKEYKNSYWK